MFYTYYYIKDVECVPANSFPQGLTYLGNTNFPADGKWIGEGNFFDPSFYEATDGSTFLGHV